GPGDATERRAVLQSGRAAGAEPVAGPCGVQLVAGASRRQTDGSERVERAPAHAVAASVLTAAGGALVATNPARVDRAVVDGSAGPGARGDVAGDAGPLAGRVAAHPVGAEGRVAVVACLARHPVGALAAAPARVTGVARHALVGGRAVVEACPRAAG